MTIAAYSIKNRVISWVLFLLLLIGGSISFTGLGQLEFPEFPIPQAMINTVYPGASPEQVEEEVTLPIERAILELEYVKHIDSNTTAGMSQIMVELHERYPGDAQPQIWDELRRKVNDVQAELPPGVYPSQVIDDFSDVYGILFNLSSDDYSFREMENYADFLQRELLAVEGVKKVNIAGTVTEQVVIEVSQQDMHALGIDPSWILNIISSQNVVSNAGSLYVQGQSIRIHPTGEFNDIDDLASLIISPPGSNQLIRLGDIADIRRQFDETPTNLYRSNGKPALSLGISFAKGVNVVDVGIAVDAKLAELESARPIGMEMNKVYDQPTIVDHSVEDFLISLAQAVGIVIVVLLFAMGLRSGILMGGILLLTILGTFIGMNVLSIEIQIISLGALIIALGMLVDNAIVITEGVLVGLKRGMTKLDAINLVVKQNQWPLLGATVIAIIAFAPIGLSPDSTGDFLGSLFQVLLISLLLSWIVALTLTPFFCELMFKEEINEGGEAEDPYRGLFFSLYRGFLTVALRHRVAVTLLTLAMLVASVIGFGSVRQAFFPPSNTPMFYVDVWMQQGTDIRQNQATMVDLEGLASEFEGVENVTTVMGMGAQRFILTYAPEKVYPSFAQLIIEATDVESIENMLPGMQTAFSKAYPDIEFKFKLMDLGPAPAAKVEARFYGPDPEVLRQLASQAVEIMENEPQATAIRHSWREKTNVIRPTLDEAAARRAGISKQALDNTLLVNFTGQQVGVFRDGSHILPMVMRAPDAERLDANRINELQIWSQERNAWIPLEQVVTGFDVESENSLIVRRDFKRVISVMSDVRPFSDDTSDSLRNAIKDEIEAITLPDGYSFEWGGEYETQQSATASLFTFLPMGYLAMFLITVFLFNTIRQPLAIWFTVPLAIIGVTAGLLLLNIPFSFTALLGLLSLSGMIVKNGIVLVEQINVEIDEGQSIHDAIVLASVSRVRPVCMAALTTMLGMIPLVFDAFFQSMAVTIIFGLGFATVLTLIVLPVVYSLLYRVSYK
ncbi:efflux RND transporter permease subunit [Thaumasiovibrio subtropicus]|uniref:efflux RND transporter permease subunit n=1 Tax=Thaumasiovibrio subtropicus TaxID=1891207 RepID=UPI000B3602E9|nr:efflux RND transporter permease subunit [Thaumasiovibrio subtropicus]